MRLKSELYKEEQERLRLAFFSILDIPNRLEFLAQEIENDANIIQQITSLIPGIRRYFSASPLKAFTNMSAVKRPWFSVFKFMIKDTYNLVIVDHYVPSTKVKTRKYILQLKTI